MNRFMEPRSLEGLSESSLSEHQEKWLSLLPLIPSLLSIIASSIIVYLVCLSRFNGSYRRLVFSVGVMDIVSKAGFALQPFLVPVETSFRVYAVGNDASCSLVATLTQFSLGVFFYNGVLSLYFLLTVRSGLKETEFARRYEIWAHCLASGWPVATAIIGAAAGFYHEQELGPGCWINDFPEDCGVDASTDCKTNITAWVIALAPMWAMVVLVSVNTSMLAVFVRNEALSGALDSKLGHDMEMSTQATLYAVAFLATYIPMALVRSLETFGLDSKDEDVIFPLLVIQALVMPLNGVCLLCVYLRPRYLRCRSAYPEEARVWAAQRALYGELINPNASILSSSSFHPSRRQSKTAKRVSSSGSSLTFRRASASNNDILGLSQQSNHSRPTSSRFDDESSAFKIAEIMEESATFEDDELRLDPLAVQSHSDVLAVSTEKEDEDDSGSESQ